MTPTPRRAVTVRDKQMIIDHLIRLQSKDRRLRFGMVATDEYIRSYLNRAFDTVDDNWFIIECDDKVVAACHVSCYSDECELGLSVDTDYRGNGNAQAIFNRAMTLVKARGIKAVFMHCLSENTAVKHIAIKNHMTVVSSHGESNARVAIDTSNMLMSAYENDALERIAIVDMLVRNNMKLMKTLFNIL